MRTNLPEVRYLFVYGTLRPSYRLLPHNLRRLRPPHVLDTYGRCIGTAMLRGYELWDVGDYPGVIRKEGRIVVGDLYDASGVGDEMAILDAYEGIAEDMERPHEYKREMANVEIGNEKVLAWIYVYNWELGKSGERVVEGGDYVKYVAESMVEDSRRSSSELRL